MTELCELFLYIALDKWVNRLADEAGKVVPAAVAAVKAADAMFEDPRAPAPSASNESTEVEDIHPAVLLQHLPGGVLAVKSVLLAKHRARQMKLQAKLAKFCCCPQVSQLESASAQPASSLLDQAGSRSATALARFIQKFKALAHLRRAGQLAAAGDTGSSRSASGHSACNIRERRLICSSLKAQNAAVHLSAARSAEAQEALARGLRLLRLAEALCGERRKLRSFWPLPDDAGGQTSAEQAEKSRRQRDAFRFC